ncbi:MAG: TonB-dependent receptor, partial [Acidobacteriaceae bacterium]
MSQATTGEIVGTVTDSTGAAIPNASIKITDQEKGTVSNIKSNSAGEFALAQLIPDDYTVDVSEQGFKGFEQKGVHVVAGEAPEVSAVLAIGSSEQTVVVRGDQVPQLKTEHVDVATIYSAQDIESLPIPDHNFANLQLLLPGAVQLGWAHAADENPQGSKQIQIDGQAFGGVNYTLDGTDNQDAILGIIVINPNSDSMSDVKIATQNYDAEFGKAVASVDTVSTKSGTNQFHGTAFDNRESSANLARDSFSESGSGPIPAGLKNQFGGSIGGPVIKDKIFFFGDYQGVRQKVGTSETVTVPTANLISSCLGATGCDFSEYEAYGASLETAQSPKNPYQVYDPNQNHAPVTVIPASEISPTAMNLFKLLQPYAPNIINSGSDGGLTDNYQGSGTGLFNSNQWDARVDATISQKTHAFGRFSRFTDVLSGPVLFGDAGGSGLGLAGYGGTSLGANDSLALGTDVAVSNSLVTEVRLGYFRYNVITHKYDTGNTNLPIQGENISGTGVNSALTVGVDYGAPDIDVADLNVTNPTAGPNNAAGAGAQYGAGLNVNRCNCPLTEREDQFQIVNNWTKVIRTHSIKFGVDLRYARNLRVPSDNDRTGVNNFSPGPTSEGADGGLGLATYVLGDVTAFNRYASTSTNAKEFQKRDFFFAQDTWRTTPKLTLNLGLRYELYFPEDVNGKGNGALLNLNTGFINVAGYGGIGSDMGVKIAKNTYNPRLGAAYQLNTKTVIRMGYGRSFDLGVFGSEFGHVVTQNLPVLVNQSIGATGGVYTYAFQLDNPASTQGGLATGLSNYVPVAPDANGQIVNPGASVNTKARPFTERLPTLDAWNFTVQRALTPTLSLTVGYVGNKGTHTLSDGDGNNTNPNESAITLPAQYSVTGSALHFDPAGGTCFPQSATCTPQGPTLAQPNNQLLIDVATGATRNQTLLQRYVGGTLPACGGACGWTQGISYYGDNQNTHYNALQMTLQQNLWHNLSGTLNYAYQVGTDAASGYATWSHSAVFGNDSSIRRSAITAYALYKLPFGRGQEFMGDAKGVVNQIVSGFEFSPTFVYESGLPFTLSFGECGNDIPGAAPCYV